MNENEETQLAVEGMSCPSCIRHIHDALRGLAGVQDVRVQLDQGQVTVKHDPAAASLADLIGAITEAGYTVREADR